MLNRLLGFPLGWWPATAGLGLVSLLVGIGLLWKQSWKRKLLVPLSVLAAFILIFIYSQKEHDRIMSDICLPKLKEYYQVPANSPLPYLPSTENGYPYWWDQHTECETNVLSGKEPTFTKRPEDKQAHFESN